MTEAHPREGVRDSLARLSGAQKSAVGAPAYLRWVNRPAGRLLAALAHRTGLTPDAVSLLSFATTIVALAAVALPSPTPVVGIGVAILLALGFALDSADGQLARLRGAGSPAGEWLDHVLDAAKHVLLPAAVLIAWFRADMAAGWLVLPLLAQLTAVVSFSGGLLHEKLRRAPATPSTTTDERAWGRGSALRAVLMLPADYGSTCLVFLLWGWPTVFAGTWAALLGVQAVLTALFLRRWRHDLAAPRTQA
ncbi:CDP-alcohol phosphatidyltransferase family protein [Knoellia sp. LjRoot47]|uniref:CDP-alcohol phosphatidyltransferase family protein n=1 Tax=Knoellia sp. LjRoot47 TaxID=3342330 RepID=UPI003ECD1591